MKREVMWAEITKLVVRLNGYEGEALAQLVDEYKECKNELCLTCGKRSREHLGACDGCKWR